MWNLKPTAKGTKATHPAKAGATGSADGVVVVGVGSGPVNMNPIDCQIDCPESYEPTVAHAPALQHDTPLRKLVCDADAFGVATVDHEVPSQDVNQV